MGTASTTKPIKNVNGTLTEFAALTTSAGPGDANALPALNAAGILDDSIINASASSSANKVVKMNGSGVIAPAILNATITSAGSADTGKIAQLDASGRLDSTVLPVGMGADTASITTSEALAAGDFVNVWSSSGAKVRKADASVSGKEAHGFVLSSFGSGVAATVYFEATNTSVTGQTPGVVFLSTAPGLATSSAPTGSGNVVQRIGFALSSSTINFQSQPPVVLA